MEGLRCISKQELIFSLNSLCLVTAKDATLSWERASSSHLNPGACLCIESKAQWCWQSRLSITRLNFPHLSSTCNWGKMHVACPLPCSIFQCRIPWSKQNRITLCFTPALAINNFLIFVDETLCPACSPHFISSSMNESKCLTKVRSSSTSFVVHLPYSA